MPHGSEWLIVFVVFVLGAGLVWWTFRQGRAYTVDLEERAKKCRITVRGTRVQ